MKIRFLKNGKIKEVETSDFNKYGNICKWENALALVANTKFRFPNATPIKEVIELCELEMHVDERYWSKQLDFAKKVLSENGENVFLVALQDAHFEDYHIVEADNEEEAFKKLLLNNFKDLIIDIKE